MTGLQIYLLITPLIIVAVIGAPILLWLRHDAEKDRRRHGTRTG